MAGFWRFWILQYWDSVSKQFPRPLNLTEKCKTAATAKTNNSSVMGICILFKASCSPRKIMLRVKICKKNIFCYFLRLERIFPPSNLRCFDLYVHNGVQDAGLEPKPQQLLVRYHYNVKTVACLPRIITVHNHLELVWRIGQTVLLNVKEKGKEEQMVFF